jgi:hypothetical protein
VSELSNPQITIAARGFDAAAAAFGRASEQVAEFARSLRRLRRPPRAGVNLGRDGFRALNSALSMLGGPYVPRRKDRSGRVGVRARRAGTTPRQMRRVIRAERRAAKASA